MVDATAETETTTFCPNRGGMPYLERHRRRATVAFCTGCEFAIELTP